MWPLLRDYRSYGRCRWGCDLGVWTVSEHGRILVRRLRSPFVKLCLILGLLSLSGCATSYYLAGKEAMADFHPPARMDADCDALGLHVNEVAHDVRGFSMEGLEGLDGCFPCGLLMLGGYDFIESRRAKILPSNPAPRHAPKAGLFRYTLVPRIEKYKTTCERFDYVNTKRAQSLISRSTDYFGGPYSFSDKYTLKDAKKLNQIVGAKYNRRAQKFCIQVTPINKFTAPFHVVSRTASILGGEMAGNKGRYKKNSITIHRRTNKALIAEFIETYVYTVRPRFGPPPRRMCIAKRRLNLPNILVPIGRERLKQTQTLINSIRGTE